jgi:hypothetical protein
VVLPTDNGRRQYATVVKGTKLKRHKITVRSRGTYQPEDIKQILKAKISSADINVGVNTLKSVNGGVQIVTNSTDEVESLGKEMQTKCGDELETHIHRL